MASSNSPVRNVQSRNMALWEVVEEWVLQDDARSPFQPARRRSNSTASALRSATYRYSCRLVDRFLHPSIMLCRAFYAGAISSGHAGVYRSPGGRTTYQDIEPLASPSPQPGPPHSSPAAYFFSQACPSMLHPHADRTSVLKVSYTVPEAAEGVGDSMYR